MTPLAVLASAGPSLAHRTPLDQATSSGAATVPTPGHLRGRTLPSGAGRQWLPRIWHAL